MSAFEQRFGWEFISGLPKKAFNLALLWRPMTDIKMRPRKSPDSSQRQICTLPTWCWAAWTGDVYWDPWRMNSYAGKAISFETEVQQFALMANGELGLISTGEGEKVNSDIKDTIRKVQERRLESATGSQLALTEEDTLPDVIAFFKACTCDLSNFSISSANGENLARARVMSKSHRWQTSYNVLMYDSKGHHCGTLYGLNSTMGCLKTWSTCELILLSRCGQDEISQSDIDAYQDHLPLEYPSSEEYYSEIFDMKHYKYTEWWALNVLLVEWFGDFARRVAVGQIHCDAWERTRTSDKVVALV